MLERSHGKLLERLTGLRAAAAAIALGQAGEREREALEEVLAFLEGPAARHETDEEESFFPRLRGRGLDEHLDGLTREHRQHEQLHRQLRNAAGGSLDRAAGLELARLGEELYRAYRAHIEAEEELFLPTAQELLDAEARAAILEEMQARRGR